MPRKPTDICLLCDNRKAVKKNSHIIPKFISSDFLGDKGNKKGFVIDSLTGVKKTIQDSPKEDYILCNECEEYFSVIEGQVAQEVKRVHAESEGEVINPIVIQSENMNPKTFHLFYYSQFWRVSISNLPIFKSFKLSENIEKTLKNELNKFNSQTKEQYEQAIAANDLDNLKPYAVFTTLTFNNKTKNLIFSPGVSFPFCLIADKYGLVLYDDIHNIPDDVQFLFNTQGGHAKIALVPLVVWEEVLVNKPFEILSDTFKANSKRREKLVAIADKLNNLSASEASEVNRIVKDEFGFD